MSIGKTLKILLENKEITQQQVADHLGISRQAVSRWVKDKTDPTTKTLEELARFLNVQPGTFFDKEEAVIRACLPEEEDPDKLTVAIPEFRFKISAGERYVDDWQMNQQSRARWYCKDFFDNRGIRPEDCVRCRAGGDSMEPFIFDGDHVLFHIEQNLNLQNLRDGEVYVLSINGGLKIKRLSTQKDALVVRSDNPNYETEIYAGSELDGIRIYGRVLEITRTL